MIRRILALLVLCVSAQAATHYVSSTTGVNSGTGPIGAPWQTLAYAMSNVAAGDTVLLRRGDVWNEALAISQNNLTIDAYGSGPAPRITGYQALTTWTSQGGNVWSAPMASGTTCSPSARSVLFNEVVGERQSAQNTVLHDHDFWCNSGASIYVYATSSPSSYYGRVAAITPSGSGNSLISIAGKTGITIQHLQLDYFDGYGVYVSGTASNLTFANMSVNGILIGENPFVTIAGSRPYGFYVATGTSATTISFVNVDAHLNYDGFRFDSYGAGSQITLTGCRAFANRDVGIFDATTGTAAVTYNYTHLYANGITTIESTDATGNVLVGSGNRPANEAPVVQGLDRFPALFSFTIDDVGLSAGTETYIDTLTPVFDAHGVKMNMAATAGFNPNITEMAAWATAGHEIDSHSWSHEYYTNVGDSTSSQNMFSLRYGPVGTKTAATGTAATMTISGNPLTLSTMVTGGPGGQNLSIDLTTPPNDTLAGLIATIQTNYPNVYTITSKTIRSNAPTHNVTLATVSTPVDIRSGAYTAVRDTTAFWTDEIQKSKEWLLAHISGLASVPVYVYPGGWNTPASDLLVASSGYVGGRGQIGMHPPGHTTASPLYATDYTATGRGVDVQNIISLTPALWHGLTQAQIDAQVGALVFKAQAWGVPFGLFAHNTDLLTPQEVGWILDSILGRHGQIKKNSELVTYLQTGALVSGTTQYLAPVIGPIPSMRAAGSSPEHGAGPTVGINDAMRSYNVDILGGMRPVPGTWDIGAYPSALWGTQHGSSGTSKTTIYGKYAGVSQENLYCGPGDVPSFGSTDGPASLPQQCTYTAMSGTPSPGTVRTATSCGDIATKLAAVSNNSGDTVVIPVSLGTCVGTWAIGYQGDAAHWLTIRTDQIANANFPAEGVRANPCQIGIAHVDGYPDYPCGTAPTMFMPTLSTNSVGNNPVLDLSGSKFVRVIGLNLTKEIGINLAGSLVNMTGGNHIILDRVLIHSNDWSVYNYLKTVKTGVSTKGTYQAVINSWVYDIDYPNADGQAIVGGIGSQTDEGPIKLYNNLLSGSSETWLWGGGGGPWPHDFEIRRNLSMKPLKWMAAFDAATFAGSNQTWPNIKNLGELKTGRRILYEENVFMNEWVGQSDQWGNALLFTPANQSRQITDNYANATGTDVVCAKGFTMGIGTVVDATAKTVTRPSGSFVTEGVTNGMAITFYGFTNTGNKNTFTVTNVTATVLTLSDPTNLLVNEITANNNAKYAGVPCAAGTGIWGNTILSMSRTNGIVTLNGANNGATPSWPYFSVGKPIYIQGIPSQTVNGVNLNSFNNQEWVMGCLNPSTCTGGTTNVIYFAAAGPDFPLTTLTTPNNALIQDYTTSNCGDALAGVSPGGCRFAAPSVSYPGNHIASIITTEHITTVEDNGTRSGVTQVSCRPGGNPDAQVQDLTVRYNYITHSASIGLGATNAISGCADISKGVSNVSVHDNLADDIDAAAWNRKSGTCCSHGGFGPQVKNGFAANQPANLLYAHNTFAGLRGWLAGSWSGGFELSDVSGNSYFANTVFRDNIFPGPFRTTVGNGNLLAGGVTAGFNKYLCSDHVGTTGCTWTYKNNLMGTALYSGYSQPTNTPYPTTNPDTSPVGGWSVADFSGVFASWGNGLGNTTANDYAVTNTYKNAASDGKDVGADIVRWKALKQALMPTFTFNPLTITTTSLTDCIVSTYCEQQIAWSGGASPFIQAHITAGSLPAGMSFANGDGYSSCQVNGSYSKNGPSGCAAWIWGTPTATGSFPITIQIEDAAHQKASVNLTLTVN